MSKIKSWKKWGKIGNVTIWRGDRQGKITLRKFDRGKYRVNIHGVKTKSFTNERDALKFASNWMRKHPTGK